MKSSGIIVKTMAVDGGEREREKEKEKTGRTVKKQFLGGPAHFPW